MKKFAITAIFAALAVALLAGCDDFDLQTISAQVRIDNQSAYTVLATVDDGKTMLSIPSGATSAYQTISGIVGYWFDPLYAHLVAGVEGEAMLSRLYVSLYDGKKYTISIIPDPLEGNHIYTIRED